MINLEKVERGSIVWYRLLPKDLPIKPNKLWRGQVDYCGPFGIRVSSLEPGYENLQEWIRYEQVIGIEKGMDICIVGTS
jgi:hypothetical protein